MTFPSPMPPPHAGPPLAPLPPLTMAYASAPMPQIPPEWTGVEIFALRPETLGPFIRLVILLQIAITLLLTGTALAALAFMGLYHTAEEWIFLGVVLGVITTITTSIKIFRAVRKQRRLWQFFRLVIADQGLIQFHADRPQTVIHRADVSRITEGHDSFRILLGVTSLTVSKRVEAPERVRQRLAQWMPIQPGKGLLGLSATIAWTYSLAIASVAGYFIGLTTGRRNVLLVCLAATVILSILTMLRIVRERSHAQSVRLLSLLNLIGPAMLLARLFLFPPGR